MSVLLIQFSDLHAGAKDNAVDAKWPLACENIISEIGEDVTACVIAFCGDAANAGKTEEFNHVSSLLKRLDENIRWKRPTVEITTLTVPGNHDCDLTSEDPAARDALRRLVTDKMPPSSISDILLKPQKNYFGFANDVSSTALSAAQPFYRFVDVQAGGRNLRFHLLNTAWTSTLHEIDDLRYPLDAFDPLPEPPADYSVTIMHHPINWFLMPSVRRELRDLIEAHSDLVLTGHEHEQEAMRRSVENGVELSYTEGGVLQDSARPKLCTFNTINLDFANATRRRCQFIWSGSYFERREGESLPIEANPHRVDQRYALKPSFAKSLDELEEPLTGPKGIDLRLSHLFVYPDLRRYSDLAASGADGEKKAQITQLVKSANVLAAVRTEEKALIVGSEKAGKTSFAKVLFQELHRNHEIPLLINGSKFPRTGNIAGVKRELRDAVTVQYQRMSADEYFQQPKNLRVLILDDFQNLPSDRKAREQLLSLVDEWFSKIIIFASDEFYMEVVNDGKGEASDLLGFQHFDICDFGGLRLEELAERWIRLGRQEANATELQNSVLALTEKVQQIIAITGMPHTPWLLIFTLDQAESDQAPAKPGSYAHMYQAVLTVALARTSFKQIDVAGKFTYLAELAYRLFTIERATLTISEAREFHNAHCKKYDVTIDFERAIEDFVAARVLRMDGEEIAFRYRYTFCFFVAWWLSRNIRKEMGAETVRALTARLHNETASNILVFLAFLSDDPLIIEAMQNAARRLFGDCDPATLGPEIKVLNDLKGVDSLFTLPPTSPEVNRRLRQERRDEQVLQKPPEPQDGRSIEHVSRSPDTTSDDGAKKEFSPRLHEIRAAMRTIKILGQILRNAASSKEGDDKLAIMEEAVAVGKRMLGFLFSHLKHLGPLMAEVEARCLQVMEEMRREDDSPMSAEENAEMHSSANSFATRFWFDLYWLATYSVIARLSSAVGAKELEATMVRLRKTKENDLPNHLVDLSSRLNRRGNYIPKDEIIQLHEQLKRAENKLAKVVLEAMINERLTLFDTNHAARDAVCNQMNIKVPARALDLSRRKFTSSKPVD